MTVLKVGVYARVSTIEQQTLSMQVEKMREYCSLRGWQVVAEIQETASGAKTRPEREKLLRMARKREIDAIAVWKLDRFGRSLSDLVKTLEELRELKVSFISITESLDFTTSGGRALAGMLSVFAEFERDILSERVKAGIAASRSRGVPHGRPALAPIVRHRIRALAAQRDANGKRQLNNSEIARKLGISRAAVIAELKKVEI